MVKEFEIRDYQGIALDVLHHHIQTKDILLLQAATGAGKTFVIVRMINKYYHDHPGRTFLVLAHKRELLIQFANSFRLFSKIPESDIGFACAGITSRIDVDRRVVLASVQTLANKLNIYGGADLVIVDETHRIGHDSSSQYRVLLSKLREYRPNHKTIGVTATAYRLGHGMIYGDKCHPERVNFFPELTHRITYKELAGQGFLMKLKGFVAADSDTIKDLEGIKLNAGEYNAAEAGAVMSRHVQNAVRAYEQYGSNHNHVAVFCCTIQHAKDVCEAFVNAGHSAVVIHSQLLKMEREANIALWQSGQVKIAVAINILVEGFDFPRLSCLVMARPTKSPVIFIQAIGRILRPHPDKSEALLIDLTNNVNQFGLDLDNPLFTIPKPNDEPGEAPVKVCPGRMADDSACGELLHPAVVVCPRCGYTYTNDQMPEEFRELKAVDFKADDSEPAVWFDVYDMFVNIHTGKSNKSLLRVKLTLGPGVFAKDASLWICLSDFYSGFAVDKGKQRWEEFSDDPFPDTVEEADFMASRFRQPKQVLCRKEGKFITVVSLNFTDEDLAAIETIPSDNYLGSGSMSADVPF